MSDRVWDDSDLKKELHQLSSIIRHLKERVLGLPGCIEGELYKGLIEVHMNWLERGACIFLMGFSILIGVMSIGLGIGRLDLLGRGLMPFLSAIMLFVLSLIVLVRGLQEKKKHEVERHRFSRKQLEKPVMFVSGLIIYAFLLMPLGYLITTFGLIFFMFFMMQPKKWRTDLFYAALASGLSFFLFDVLLKVRLPAGILTMLR